MSVQGQVIKLLAVTDLFYFFIFFLTRILHICQGIVNVQDNHALVCYSHVSL